MPMPYDRETWWKDKAEKGRLLVEEIQALARRAGGAGFQTTEHLLNLAVAELWKDIEEKNTGAQQ